MSLSTQKTNVLEYDYFRMYLSTSTSTLEYNHDYFNEYPVSTIKATWNGIPRCHSFSVAVSLSSVLIDYCYPLSRCYYY